MRTAERENVRNVVALITGEIDPDITGWHTFEMSDGCAIVVDAPGRAVYLIDPLGHFETL